MCKKITRISIGSVGDKLWWFGPYDRIRRIPADYSLSGMVEYWVDLLPTDKIFFSRYIKCDSWKRARAVMADPYNV